MSLPLGEMSALLTERVLTFANNVTCTRKALNINSKKVAIDATLIFTFLFYCAKDTLGTTLALLVALKYSASLNPKIPAVIAVGKLLIVVLYF